MKKLFILCIFFISFNIISQTSFSTKGLTLFEWSDYSSTYINPTNMEDNSIFMVNKDENMIKQYGNINRVWHLTSLEVTNDGNLFLYDAIGNDLKEGTIIIDFINNAIKIMVYVDNRYLLFLYPIVLIK